MSKKLKWLPYAVVATGAVIVLLVIVAINSEPLVRWFQADERSITWQEMLGIGLISMFILALLLSHMVLVVVVASSLNKPPTPAIEKPTTCPQCARAVQADWQVCPYCGFKLDNS
ncbi:MAG: zinc ribbon domain-containing protein [Anaerolineae bacterium]|nr:zinc ribbon domain-containing protein [Anaerolineae bacterium]